MYDVSVMYKTILLLILVVCTVVIQAAPADRPDPMLAELLAGTGGDTAARFARQTQEPMSPLSQLLQDALNVSFILS
jgi:hypothetical protein